MRLERLEIRGFKSFADPVVVEFPEQITAVVGPNGSGKSNIVDAFRWVLGEQSPTKLRCSSMDEVIFSGSENRRRLSLAQVVAVFDNEAGIAGHPAVELAVCRRVDRSGRSEYLLNGKRCRLRDVRETFMGTGVGADSYSIIGQGEVERILDADPEQLREYIEEVAGVTKYHRVLQRVARRLGRIKQSQDRLNDMVDMRESYLMPLHRQAVRARLHRILTKKRDSIRRDLIASELIKSTSQWQKHTEQLEQVRAEIASKQNNKQQLDERISLQRTKLKDLSRREELFVRGCKNLRKQRSQIEHTLQNLTEKMKSLSNARKRSQNAIDDVDSLKKELGEASEDRESITELKEKLKSLNLRIEKNHRLVQDLSERLRRAEGVNSRTEKFLGKLGVQKQKISGELRSMDENLQRAFTDMSRARQQIAEARGITEDESNGDSLESQIEEIKNKLSRAEERRAAASAQLTRVEKKRDELGEEAQTRRDQLTRWRARREVLRELVNSASEPDHRERPAGSAFLSDLEFPEDCERALSSALGVYKKVAVLDEVAAGEVDDAFRDQSPITHKYVLPSVVRQYSMASSQNTWSKQRQMWEDFLLNGGWGEAVQGWLDEIVELQSSSEELLAVRNYFLNRFLLVETTDDLLSIMSFMWSAKVEMDSLWKHPIYLVSLEGDVADVAGILQGSHAPSQENNGEDLVAHWGEIRRLDTAISEYEGLLGEVEGQLRQVRQECHQYSDELESAEESVRTYKQELNQIQQKYQHQKSTDERARKQLSNARKKREELSDTIDKLQRKKAQLEREQKRLERARTELTSHRTRWQNKLQKRKENLQKETENLEELREKRAALQEKLKARKTQLQEREKQRENIRQQISKWSTEIEDIRRQEDRILDERRSLRKRLHAVKEALDRADQGREEVIQERKEAASVLDSIQNDKDQVAADLSRLNRKENDLKLKQTKAEMKVEKATQNAREQLGADPEKLLQRADESTLPDHTGLKEEVGRYEQRMQELEPVNALAIDEYREQKREVQLLKQQRDDLQSSVSGIKSLMTEFRRQLNTKFKSVFSEVSEIFGRTFAGLFEGGSAKLKMIEEANGENGVEIHAQPPGKKLNRLSLLSGGERALTGIAFLFALLKMQSTTVCVLDEIDATLDDANTARFADYLVRNKRDTQYIIITHQKRTMEAAEALHGVTMPDDGSSQLVSVRLRDVPQNEDPAEQRISERGVNADEQPQQRAAQGGST